MKIIYLHQYFNTLSMSGGTRSFEMARRLVERGHDVHMITSWTSSSVDDKDWFSTVEHGIHVHWYPVPYSNKMRYFDRIKAFLEFAIASRSRAVSVGGDIVFATSTPLTIAFPAVYAAKKLDVPMVFEVRDLWPELPIAIGALRSPITRFAAKMLERWAYRNSDAVIALSPGMRDGVVSAGYPVQRVAVIPNSSDNDYFRFDIGAAEEFRSSRPWLLDRPLIVYAGTFGKINGVGFLVDLAKELLVLAPDVRILLVGDGKERDALIDYAKELLVLEENLFFESPVPKQEIPLLLSAANLAASLFIDLPEMRANSANKFFDALASGTPVLINYGGWMDDLVNQHKCGLAVWGKSIEEVASLVANALYDDEWLFCAGKKARTLAENVFARDKLAEQLEQVFVAVKSGSFSKVSEIAPGNY